MNGETKVIIETLRNFHKENREDIKSLFEKAEATNLTLATFITETKNLRSRVNWVYGILSGVIIVLIVSRITQ